MKQSIGAATILYPTPVMVVGTYDQAGKANVMTAAWGGICCSSPPCLAVSLRKATYTYGCLVERQAFTVSIPSRAFIREADYFGLVSGKNVDKFAESGLTPEKAEKVDAPYVKEFPFVLECKVLQAIEIGLHTQFVGEILDIKVEKEFLDEAGKPVLEKIEPFFFAPGERRYYGAGEMLGQAFTLGKEVSGRRKP